MDYCLFYSESYSVARERFRRVAESVGCVLHTYPLVRSESLIDDLTLDVAIYQTGRPRRTLVVSSGVHGVECFAGSAIQLALLEELRRARPPADVSVVLIHAVNPFGFAHLRRANEDNIDLNRNFLPPSDGPTYQGCHPLYERLDRFLNPCRRPGRLDALVPRTLWAALRHGRGVLRQAIAGGQYQFPKGLFFGGFSPTWQHGIFTRHLAEWIGTAEHILHFDVHTGLGPWAKLQLLLESPFVTDSGSSIAQTMRKQIVVLPAKAPAPRGYYRVKGEFGGFCRALLSDRKYDDVCAEFGTYPAITVLAALRAENQVYHWSPNNEATLQLAKARLSEVFTPSDPRWRSAVVRQGTALFQKLW